MGLSDRKQVPPFQSKNNNSQDPTLLLSHQIYSHSLTSPCNHASTCGLVATERGDSSSTDLGDVKLLSCESLERTQTALQGSIIILCTWQNFRFLSGERASKPPHEAVPCEVVYFLRCAAPCRLPTGACWTWWVLIQRQLAVLMDDQPSASFFLSLFLSVFSRLQRELPIQEERGEERLRSG